VVNPPYGKRIGSARTAFALVQQLMDRMPDWNALVMYALPGRLPPGWRSLCRIRNGGVSLRIVARDGVVGNVETATAG
jgi:hypothetical protein